MATGRWQVTLFPDYWKDDGARTVEIPASSAEEAIYEARHKFGREKYARAGRPRMLARSTQSDKPIASAKPSRPTAPEYAT